MATTQVATPMAAVEPITASIVPTGTTAVMPTPGAQQPILVRREVQTSGDGGEKAVKEVTGIGVALIIVIILVVIAVVWVGLRLIEAMIGGVINVLGPATECGMEIEAKQNAYVNQGMTKCDAYVKAMNEVATQPHTPCPSPGGSPPAACGLYAEYLRKVGCTPPTPCAGS